MKDWGGFTGKLPEEKSEDEFRYRECYEFNESLPTEKDDERCERCKKFLTVQCKYIDEFIEGEDE